MAKQYSIYEAKAKFSEMLRKVKTGTEVTVTERGTPVAKVIPFPHEISFAKRIKALQGQGLLLARKQKKLRYNAKRKVSGGLQRFLDERE